MSLICFRWYTHFAHWILCFHRLYQSIPNSIFTEYLAAELTLSRMQAIAENFLSRLCKDKCWMGWWSISHSDEHRLLRITSGVDDSQMRLQHLRVWESHPNSLFYIAVTEYDHSDQNNLHRMNWCRTQMVQNHWRSLLYGIVLYYAVVLTFVWVVWKTYPHFPSYIHMNRRVSLEWDLLWHVCIIYWRKFLYS